jgi:hypothetical protein
MLAFALGVFVLDVPSWGSSFYYLVLLHAKTMYLWYFHHPGQMTKVLWRF